MYGNGNVSPSFNDIKKIIVTHLVSPRNPDSLNSIKLHNVLVCRVKSYITEMFMSLHFAKTVCFRIAIVKLNKYLVYAISASIHIKPVEVINRVLVGFELSRVNVWRGTICGSLCRSSIFNCYLIIGNGYVGTKEKIYVSILSMEAIAVGTYNVTYNNF